MEDPIASFAPRRFRGLGASSLQEQGRFRKMRAIESFLTSQQSNFLSLIIFGTSLGLFMPVAGHQSRPKTGATVGICTAWNHDDGSEWPSPMDDHFPNTKQVASMVFHFHDDSKHCINPLGDHHTEKETSQGPWAPNSPVDRC